MSIFKKSSRGGYIKDGHQELEHEVEMDLMQQELEKESPKEEEKQSKAIIEEEKRIQEGDVVTQKSAEVLKKMEERPSTSSITRG